MMYSTTRTSGALASYWHEELWTSEMTVIFYLSSRISEDLREISDYYKQILRPVKKYTIKHGQTISLYSAYDKGFGNPRPPATKSSVEKTIQEKNTKYPTAVTIYPYMEVNITIKNPKSQLVHYRRLYEIKNTSENPIYEVVHGIATDVEMNLSRSWNQGL